MEYVVVFIGSYVFGTVLSEVLPKRVMMPLAWSFFAVAIVGVTLILIRALI